MKYLLILALFISQLLSQNSCTTCHGGIEPIREHNSGMMKEIFK